MEECGCGDVVVMGDGLAIENGWLAEINTGSIFNLSLRVVYCVQTNEINPGMNLDTLTPLYFTFISIKFIQPTRH